MNRHGDRGSATVWTAALAAGLCVVFAAVLGMGQAVLSRHRAGGAADLAALAAADHAVQGAAVACREAGRVARAQAVRLVECTVSGEIADVTAEATWGPYAAQVRARAGPAGSGLSAPRAGTFRREQPVSREAPR
ncbi:Rv3654c family TadE-like protein [Streptomyces meridianus]|uniref:Flp pilus-assembly TadE/G-like family protein n=1 Tax=Streptomyces meridianus TaxID=2938945 RepID=A0ABT0X7E5_9ACTN|nr:Rv3654c family TadE-like protein [Streptomyces meridianus]MCM2577699.1 flp pilus-assembly TadE/G-like family protein [Streptomyces meridianus]